nr:hypothetical protein BaRGS_017401 [Batillaria attramentaria]
MATPIADDSAEKTSGDSFVDNKVTGVRGPSLITLSHILQDPDLDLIQLDPDILQYFLDCAHKAFGITQEDPVQSSPAVEELLEENTNALAILGIGEVEFLLDQLQVDNTAHAQRTTAQPQHTTKRALHALAELARNDNCRREIFARGGLDLLASHLQKGSLDEKLGALNLLQHLTVSSEYRSIIQSKQGLSCTLRDLSQSDNAALSRAAGSIDEAIKDDGAAAATKMSVASPNISTKS